MQNHGAEEKKTAASEINILKGLTPTGAQLKTNNFSNIFYEFLKELQQSNLEASSTTSP